jgi:hypothetical protein
MSESKTTTDHQEIQKWVEARCGQPAVVKGTEDNEESEGLLRIRFSDESKDSLKAIGWDKFFETFEDKNLHFCTRTKLQITRKAGFLSLLTAKAIYFLKSL